MAGLWQEPPFPARGWSPLHLIFQRTGPEFVQELFIKQCDFATYQQQTAEDGLVPD
jgi:hypothetical protein